MLHTESYVQFKTHTNKQTVYTILIFFANKFNEIWFEKFRYNKMYSKHGKKAFRQRICQQLLMLFHIHQLQSTNHCHSRIHTKMIELNKVNVEGETNKIRKSK